MGHEFQVTFESNFLAIMRGLESCVKLTIDCEADVTGSHDFGELDGLEIKGIFDEDGNEVKISDLAEGEQKQIQKLADDYAESKILDWVLDDDCARGDAAYDAWKDREMDEAND